MRSEAYIYGLFDSSGALRYVGKANNAEKRLQSHMRDVRRRPTPLYSWIRKHGKPEMRVLRVCTDQDWREAEREIIAAARARGDRLLNVADGGDEPFCSTETRRENGRRMRFHPACIANRKANGAKVAERMRNDDRAYRLKEIKRRLSDALVRGHLSDFAKDCMRECYRADPAGFRSWSQV